MAETCSPETERKKFLQAEASKLFFIHDPTPFYTFLNHLFEKDTNLRSNALSIHDYAKKHYPNAYALRFTEIIGKSYIYTTRKNCAVLLKRLFSTPHSILSSISSITLPGFLTNLLFLLQTEQAQEILEIIGTVIALIAQDLLPKNRWDELYIFMFNGLSSELSHLKLRSLLLFAKIIPLYPQLFTPRVNELYNSFIELIDTKKSTHEMILAAVKASVMLVLYLTTPLNHDRYIKLITCTGEAMFDLTNEDDETHAQKILEEMIILAGIKTSLFKEWYHNAFEFMLEICEETYLESKTRQLIIELVITVAEDKECCCAIKNTLPNLYKSFINVFMRILVLTIIDDPKWGDEDNDDTNKETKMYSHAIEYITRFRNALSDNSFILPEDFNEFLNYSNWRNRHAATTTLSLLSEGCSKDIMNYIETLTNILLKLMKDPHPRVRYEAIKIVGEFSVNLNPYIQEQFHEQLISALIVAIDDFDNPRVQTRAILAMQLFSKNCTKQMLKPHLNTIVSKLLQFLQKGKQMLKEAALSALGTLAYSCQEEFEEYYEQVVSHMMVFFVNASNEDDSNRMLVVKHLDCLTMVGLAVEKKKFCNDIQKILDVIHDEYLCDPNHPGRVYVLQMWGRLCKCLGSDFKPFLSLAMPALLYSADLKEELFETQDSVSEDETISSDSDDSEDSDNFDLVAEITGDSNDKSVAEETNGKSKVRTRESVNEEKAVACNILCCIISELKEELNLWIHEIVKVLAPLVIDFELHEDVRIAAISAMPMMMQMSVLAMEKKLPIIGLEKPPFRTLCGIIFSALLEALNKEMEMEICEKILEALKECVEISGNTLNETQITQLIDGLIEFLEAFLYNKRQRKIKVKNGLNTDTRRKEILKEERIYAKVGDYMGAFIRIFKDLCLPYFDKVLPCVALMWGNDKNSGERKVAIRIFLDVAEQCGDKAFKHYETKLRLVFKACKDENPDVRQVVAWAIGVCAEFGDKAFQSHIQDGICSLKSIIEYPCTRLSDNLQAYESAISALGKICRFQSQHIENPERDVFPYFLKHLPLQGADLNESKIVHEHFCSMLEMLDQKEPGPWKFSIVKVIQIFAEILWAGYNRATPETIERIVKLLKKFHVIFPTFDKICDSLPQQYANMLRSTISSSSLG